MSYNRYINNFPNESEFTKYIGGSLADVPNIALIDDTGEMKYTKSFADYYVMYGTTTGSTDFMIGSLIDEDYNPDCIQVHVVVKPDGNNEMYVKPSDVLKTPVSFTGSFSLTESEGRKITSISKWKIDTSHVIKMDAMFDRCSSLKTIDLSGFDTSRVTSMSSLFGSCSSLTSVNLSNFNTSNVTLMDYMFCDCNSLKTIDLSGFDTSKVTNMSTMFYGCSSLTSLDLRNFDTSSVTEFYGLSGLDSMFSSCSNLNKLYLSNNFFNSEVLTEYDFGELTAWTDAESLAKFVEAITARDVAGKTVKLSANTKNALTQTQKDAITAKGWTIA